MEIPLIRFPSLEKDLQVLFEVSSHYQKLSTGIKEVKVELKLPVESSAIVVIIED